MVKHGLITGMSGYGKTVSQMNIMIQLWRRGIPFMVLETAKTEYRALKQHSDHSDTGIRNLAKALQVYTVGDESVSPFRHNPLEIRPGISRNAHIENVLDCFKASMPLLGPLMAILGEALEHVYEQHPDPDKPPVLTDLLSKAVRVLQEKGYSGDISSDFRAAIDVRLGTLTRRAPGAVLQCRHSVPSIDHLMSVPSIIEMDRLTPDLTCLLTLFLLTSIREFLQTSTPTRGGPRFVVILEEAHNVVGRNTNTAPQDNVADPKAHAAEFICRMLAEVRGLGVGLILANQLPSAVASEVTKSTAWKVAFRQIANDDREDLGGTMLFGPSEMEEIARLDPGEAFLMTEGYHSPRRIWAERLHERLDLDNTPSDTQLARRLRREGWFRAMTKQRRMAELTQLDERVDRLEQSIALETEQIKVLIDEHPEILKAQIPRDECRKRLRSLADRMRVRKQRLLSLRDAFTRGPYRAFAAESAETDSINPEVKKKRNELVRRVHKTIYPMIDRLIDVADKRIELKQPSQRRMQDDAKKK